MSTNRPSILLIPLLALFESLAYLSTDMYLPALPSLQTSLGLSLADTQLTLTAWFLGSCSLQLILGPLCQMIGRRPILLAGGAVFIASTLACAFTQSFELFLLCRFLQGCTVCVVIVAGYATLHDLYDHEAAIKALALMGALTVLAPAIGPVLGGYITELGNWRSIFLFLCLAALFCIPLLARFLPETVKEPKAVRLQPIIKAYFQILSTSRFYVPTLITCFIFGGFIAWLSASPMLLMQGFQLSPKAFGYCQLAVFGSYVLGTRFVKLALKKYTSTQLTIFGTRLSLAGGIACLLLTFWGYYLLPFLAAVMCYAFGTGLSSSSINRAAMESSEHPTSMKMALYSFAMSAFGVAGSWVITYIPVGFILGCAAMFGFFLNHLRTGYQHEQSTHPV